MICMRIASLDGNFSSLITCQMDREANGLYAAAGRAGQDNLLLQHPNVVNGKRINAGYSMVWRPHEEPEQIQMKV